jgi:hypothetical protein
MPQSRDLNWNHERIRRHQQLIDQKILGPPDPHVSGVNAAQEIE